MTKEELDLLEQKLNAVELQIRKAEIRIEVTKTLNRYETYFQGADCNGITHGTCAWDDPDIWIDAGMGARLDGGRASLEFFDQRPALARMPGALVEHESCSMIVEVADDCMTAKTCDFAPGYKCLALGRSQVWSMGKCYHDFKQIDGQWLIFHRHWFVVCEAEAAYGLLYQNRSYWKECMFDELDSIHNGNITVPPVFVEYQDNYRKDGHLYLYPEPPDPYQTFDGNSDFKRTRGY